MGNFRPEKEELKKLGLIVAVMAACFTAFSGILDPSTAAKYIGISLVVLLTRELGQRTVAEWMEAYVTTDISIEGSAVSLVTAIFAVVSGLPIIALFPVENSFSGKKYEHWGKSIDAIWMKRQYWLASSGIVALLLGWIVTYSLGWTALAVAMIVFVFFQLMPFDYSDLPTGTLDGAYIMRWSGFMWLTLMGTTFIALGITLF